jgi:hypothetical protein
MIGGKAKNDEAAEGWPSSSGLPTYALGNQMFAPLWEL